MAAQTGNRKIDPHSNSFWWNHFIYRLIKQAEWFQRVQNFSLLFLSAASVKWVLWSITTTITRLKCSVTGSLTLLVFMVDRWLLIFRRRSPVSPTYCFKFCSWSSRYSCLLNRSSWEDSTVVDIDHTKFMCRLFLLFSYIQIQNVCPYHAII